ncbi:hypothetical protein Clacol_005454 [Clathrus columnatus]|uniref:Uncharacterized protein n=1 Tax=Clathrus columnatus TaxID=1419009 RepID=A0AAV5A9D6_9AGAM|nr:hypothetical protein Clacol_005454 [Clathrus columnatus]
MSVFRESSVIVIESSKRYIRAGVGVSDFLHVPTLVPFLSEEQEVPARVGLRKNPSTSRIENGTETHNGAASRLGKEEDIEMSNGYQNGKLSSKTTTKYISRPCRQLGILPDAKVSDYLVGQQLDDALAAKENVEVYWPLDDGDDIRSWPQVEALWKYVLFNRLGLRRKQNESPVALCVPCYPRETHELLAQLFFERFNVAAFMLVERPLMQTYAVNLLYGVVVDVSYSDTTITPVVESLIQYNNTMHIDVGMKECEIYLTNILRSQQALVAAISENETFTEEQLQAELLDLTRQIWRDGLVKVPSDGETAQTEDEEGVTDIAALLVAGKEVEVVNFYHIGLDILVRKRINNASVLINWCESRNILVVVMTVSIHMDNASP